MGIGKLMPFFKDKDEIEKKLNLRVLASIPSVIDKSENVAKKRLDKTILVASLAYFGLILLVLMREVLYRYMGINLISF
jgi:hypothetical protein